MSYFKTNYEARKTGALESFNTPSIPAYIIEPYPFERFSIETEIELPILEPFTPEAHKYFRGSKIIGISRCDETETYLLVGQRGITHKHISDFIESL